MDRKSLKENNTGSTLLLVIIAMAFIGILATMVMSMSMTNVQMKSVDRNSKENFYAAETAVDELKAGLEVELASLIEESYSRIMIVYGELPVSERNLKFKEDFKNSFLTKFESSGEFPVFPNTVTKGKYDCNVLKDFLVKTKAHTKITSNGDPVLEWQLNYGDLSEQYICFRNVNVTYVDEREYLTNITTDFKISIPNVNLESIGSMPPFAEFAAIANHQFLTENSTGSVVGNLYAGDAGILVNGGSSKLTVQADKVVTREALKVLNGASVVMDDKDGDASHTGLDLWARNIETIHSSTISTLSPKMDLTANFYIADDTTLNAPNSNVKLSGSYFGYGHQDAPENSSAMIINRSNCTLNLHDIENMFLAGRAYVEPMSESIEDSGVSYSNTAVKTGEAISTKGNQFVYLLPGEAIGVGLKDDNGVGYNPITIADYEAIKKDSKVKEVDLDYIVPFSNKPLSYYIDDFITIFDQTYTTTLVYYYPHFKDEYAANKYFNDYIAAGGSYLDTLKNRLHEYQSSVIPPSNILDSKGRKTYAGNVLFYQSGAENPLTVYKNSVDAKLPKQFVKESDDLREIYNALIIKLLPSVAHQYSATELSKYATLYDSLINEVSETGANDGLIDQLEGLASKTFTADQAEYGSYILVNNEKGKEPEFEDVFDSTNCFVVDSSISSDVHIIIATGDVLVKSNFKGLIISKGMVKIENGAEITSDPQAVFDLICYSDIRTVFRDYKGFGIYLTGEANQQVNISDLITTENWNKN